MEPSAADGNQDLVQFWEEIPPVQRLKPDLRLTTKNYNTSFDPQKIHTTLLHVMDSCNHLERKLDHSLWNQKASLVLVTLLTALWGFTVFVHYSSTRST